MSAKLEHMPLWLISNISQSIVNTFFVDVLSSVWCVSYLWNTSWFYIEIVPRQSEIANIPFILFVSITIRASVYIMVSSGYHWSVISRFFPNPGLMGTFWMFFFPWSFSTCLRKIQMLLLYKFPQHREHYSNFSVSASSLIAQWSEYCAPNLQVSVWISVMSASV